MKKTALLVLPLFFLMVFLSNCEKQETEQITTANPEWLGESVEGRAGPPTECDCRLSSSLSSYSIHVCGLASNPAGSCTPASPTCIIPTSAGEATLSPSNLDFKVKEDEAFQLKNTGSSTFTGTLVCNTGNTTNVGISITLAAGAHKDYIADDDCDVAECSSQ